MQLIQYYRGGGKGRGEQSELLTRGFPSPIQVSNWRTPI